MTLSLARFGDINSCTLQLLTGSLAVLIDSDHILAALNFPVIGRPDHSILYAAVSLIALVLLGRKLGLAKQTIVKLAFVAPIAVMSHIAYDVFAASGPTFPLLVPLEVGEIFIPYYFWYVLEGAALLISLVGCFAARKYSLKQTISEMQAQSVVEPDSNQNRSSNRTHTEQ